MKKQIEQLREFNRAYGVPILEHPEVPMWGRIALRERLAEEELKETFVAARNNDIVESADGIVDQLYILLGTALEFGLGDKLEAMFDEVHRSNMSKLAEDGSVIRRGDGKVLKGPNFTPPDLKTIIETP